MSEAIARGTSRGMRRWYYMKVPRCRFRGCIVYTIRSPFSDIKRCAKHSVVCEACAGKEFLDRARCSACNGLGRIPCQP